MWLTRLRNLRSGDRRTSWTWGEGQAEWGKGQAEWGKGQAEWGKGQAEWGKGQAREIDSGVPAAAGAMGQGMTARYSVAARSVWGVAGRGGRIDRRGRASGRSPQRLPVGA